MSLATQITALATAVGAAMKTLTGRVTTLESRSAGIPIQPPQTDSYTFVPGDLNTNTPFALPSSSATATIPADMGANGDAIYIAQDDVGAVSFAFATGVNYEAPNDMTTNGIGDMRAAVWRSANLWYVQ